MIALKIPDQKDFTTQLFLGETFDAFHVSSAAFTTGITINLDGRLHKDYYSQEEWDALKQQDLARWSMLRPLCFQIIKGNRLPEQFKLVFVLSRSNTEKLVQQTGLSVSPDQIGGLFLNIRYEQGVLTCITGVSFTTFLPDKTVEHAWDDMVRRFFRSCKIPFEET